MIHTLTLSRSAWPFHTSSKDSSREMVNACSTAETYLAYLADNPERQGFRVINLLSMPQRTQNSSAAEYVTCAERFVVRVDK